MSQDKAVSQAAVETLHFADDGETPNNPHLPVILYRDLPEGLWQARAEARLAENGWGGAWRNGIFARHHYHSNAHEVLIVVGACAEVILGGRAGKRLVIGAGEAMLLPAGTGHCLLEADRGFAVVGAYPHGQEDYDLIWSDPAEHARALARIARVPLPAADPLFGPDGPVMQLWNKGAG